MQRTGLLVAVMIGACGDMPGVEEVDRGAKPIEARSADDVVVLAAWDEDDVAHTLVVVAGVRRWVCVDVQGVVTVADEHGAALPDDDRAADRLRTATQNGELSRLRVDLLQ